jgi:hypothetical protein
MAVVARDGIEPPPLQQFLFSEKNTRYAGRTSAACLSVPLESVQKVGICGDFGRFLICRCGEDGPEDEMAVDTVSGELLSGASSCKQGKIQGISRFWFTLLQQELALSACIHDIYCALASTQLVKNSELKSGYQGITFPDTRLKLATGDL